MRSLLPPPSFLAILALAFPCSVPARAQTMLRELQVDPSRAMGRAVAGGADVDGDGIPDVIGGDPEFDGDRGQAAVWSGGDGSLLHRFEGLADPASPANLGHAVSFVPDLDGDGVADLALAAWDDPTVGINAGAVEVRSGGSGALLVKLLAREEFDRFGSDVAGIEDVTGDGLGELVVGARNAGETFCCSTGAPGKVYVFSGADLAQGIDAPIRVHENTEEHLRYGHAVAAVGDFDGDGFGDYAIGDPHHDDFRGRVWIHSGPSGGLLGDVEGLSGGPAMQLGTAVAGAGDVDGDGLADVVAGATGNASHDSYAMVIHGGGGFDVIPSSSPGDHFGHAVAGIGDVDGDGADEIAITAPRDGTRGVNTGRVDLWSRGAGSWTPVRSVLGEGAFTDLGRSVAGIGDLNGDLAPEFLVGVPSNPAKNVVRAHSPVPVLPFPFRRVDPSGPTPPLSAISPRTSSDGLMMHVEDPGRAVHGGSLRVRVSGAPPLSGVFLLASPGRGRPRELDSGRTLWVDPSAVFVADSVLVSATPQTILELPLPLGGARGAVTVQALLVRAAGRSGSLLSEGLEVRVDE